MLGTTVISNLALASTCRYPKHRPTLTSVLGAMEPATAVCVGVAVFGEPFTQSSIALGILLISFSVATAVILKDDGVTR